jgi:hypothetical protein
MKKAILILTLVSSVASAQTINTPSGSYFTTVSGNTTTVTQTSSGSRSGVYVAVPVTTNAVTGIGQVITPTGSYLVQTINGTTTVIQTSKSR